MITTDANELVAQRDRTPVLLEPDGYATGVAKPSATPKGIKALLKPSRADLMVSWPVSPALNSPRRP